MFYGRTGAASSLDSRLPTWRSTVERAEEKELDGPFFADLLVNSISQTASPESRAGAAPWRVTSRLP